MKKEIKSNDDGGILQWLLGDLIHRLNIPPDALNDLVASYITEKDPSISDKAVSTATGNEMRKLSSGGLTFRSFMFFIRAFKVVNLDIKITLTLHGGKKVSSTKQVPFKAKVPKLL